MEAIIEKAFEQWRSRNEGDDRTVNAVALLEVCRSEANAAKVHLLFGSSEEAFFEVPDGEGVVRVTTTAPRLAGWCDLVNEFAASGHDSWLETLSFGVKLYLEREAGLSTTGVDDDNDADFDFGSDDDEDCIEDDDDFDYGSGVVDDDGMDDAAFTTDWEVEIARNKKRWLQKEEELRTNLSKKAKKSGANRSLDSSSGGFGKGQQAAATYLGNDGAAGEVNALEGPTLSERKQVGQIFSSNAASGILVNDLVKIMGNSAKFGFTAEPVDDNIYNWRVKISGFAKDSPIATDLQKVKERFGYDYLELQFDFAMDLYPCYPPVLSFIRPRLSASMLQRVSSLEIFKLSYWNPANDMCSMIDQVRSALESWCRVETEHEMNCAEKYPGSAFYELEHVLLRLANTSEISPRANQKFTMQVQLAPRLRIRSVSEEGEEGEVDLWAKGTGYGHGSKSSKGSWDPAQLEAARRENDKREVSLMCHVHKLVSHALSTSESVSGNIGEMLESSCLIPYLEGYLASDSIFEMAQHCTLYNHILDVVALLVEHDSLHFLVKDLAYQAKSIVTLIQTQFKMVKRFKSRLGSAASAVDSEGRQALAIVSRIEKIAELCPGCGDEGNAATADSHSDGAGRSTPHSDEEYYVAQLKDLQLEQSEILENEDWEYHYENTALDKVPQPSAVMRLAQEISSLGSSLPINLSSSVFLRIDEERVDVMKALIIGPSDTPYSGGCFEFDIYFPPTYPASPPQVNLLTTGKGGVRFNPNLYNCGKVCLSLLGTWEGQSGEQWIPRSSTLLQVLVSIQSLILVPDPWFNEPGYECELHTDKGKAYSQAYNQGLRCNTMRWAMLDQINNPSPVFKEVIRTHFKLRRKALRQMCEQWVAEAKPHTLGRTPLESLRGESGRVSQKDMSELMSRLNLAFDNLK